MKINELLQQALAKLRNFGRGRKPAMDQGIKAKWVAALRSGDYVQGVKKLRCDGNFCCLGVLCNIHAQEHPEIAAKQTTAGIYMGESESLPKEVWAWAGGVSEIVSIAGESANLAYHNDFGRSFLEIADAIESQL